MPPAVLTDFGLARARDTGSRYTRTGEALGTPAYMSPEQACGEVAELGPATDVWSLAVVCYELLTGRLPFPGETPAEVIGRMMTEAPAPLGRLRPDVPPALAAVVAAGLAREPGGRPPDGAALRDALDAVLAGRMPRLPRPARRRSFGVPVAAVLVAVAVAAAVAAIRNSGSRTVPPAPSALASSTAERLAAQAAGIRFSDPVRARALLTDALAAEPTRWAWHLELGLCCWVLGDDAAARAAWACVPDGTPETTRARLYTGLEALARLEGANLALDEGLPFFDAIASTPGPEGRIAIAAAAVARGDWAEARTALVGIEGWEAALVRGYVEDVGPGGDPRAALREYDVVLAAGPPLPGILVNRGTVRVEVGDPEGALADFERALALCPASPLPWANRAYVRQLRGDLAGALSDLDEAVRLGPALPGTLHNRAIVRHALGDLAGARADHAEAVRLAPAFLPAMYDLAGVLRELGEFAAAAEAFDRVLALRPGWPEALGHRAGVRLELGDADGALADLDVALAREPDNLQLRLMRGAAHLRRNAFASALADLDAVLERRPDDRRARYHRAVARGAAGDALGALTDCDAILAADPADGPVRLHRARIRQALQDIAGAIADVEQVLAALPADSPQRVPVEALLRDLRPGGR